MASLKILFVTPEVDPFVKVGGLADMVGALPKELAALGHDVRVVCPLYGSVKRVGDWRARAEPLGIDVGVHTVWARTWETRLPGSTVPPIVWRMTRISAARASMAEPTEPTTTTITASSYCRGAP